jgi:hypothetical protein
MHPLLLSIYSPNYKSILRPFYLWPAIYLYLILEKQKLETYNL